MLLPQAPLPQCQTLHDLHNVQCLFLFSGSLLTMLLALNTLLFLCVSDFTSMNPHLIYPDTTAASCLCAHMPFCISIFSSSYCNTLISFVYTSTHFSLHIVKCLKAGTLIHPFPTQLVTELGGQQYGLGSYTSKFEFWLYLSLAVCSWKSYLASEPHYLLMDHTNRNPWKIKWIKTHIHRVLNKHWVTECNKCLLSSD